MTNRLFLLHSATKNCAADGPPSQLRHRTVCGLHCRGAARARSGVVCLQEHQAVRFLTHVTHAAPTDQPPHKQGGGCLSEGSSVNHDVQTMSSFCLSTRCSNDSSQWTSLVVNSTDITMETHINQDNQLESQVIFAKLENSLALRCQARNELAVARREVKLVSNGEQLITHCY